MRVEFDLSDSPPAITLREPGEMTGFDVVLDGVPDIGGVLSTVGIPRFEQHVWIPVALVRALAGDAADAAWEAGFERMLAFAREHGFYSEELDAIRGHVV